MITACILGGLAFAGLKIWQNSIDNRRRSAVILIDNGLERWLVDFDRTLKDERFPAASISLFKECLPK